MAFKPKTKIMYIGGARPNFIKIFPLMEEARKWERIKPILVHTGQHYDFEMSKIFFEELKIPKPDYNLGVGSGSHTIQTAKIMERLEPILLKEKPKLVIVVGDVNSTLAGALVAAKLHIPVAHIEAGLRSFDKRMPEEINRLLTDHISDYLFASESSAVQNLLKEGIERKKIFFVGNVMIDTLLKSKVLDAKRTPRRVASQKSKILEKLRLKKKEYGVLTLHRSENVDNRNVLKEILETIEEIQKKIKIIWPIHPRAKKQLKKFNLFDKTREMENLVLIKPLGYLEMLSLNIQAKFVLTDSGGIQEETTVLGIPCLTLRENTERPITVTEGTNLIVRTKKRRIILETSKILRGDSKKGRIPRYWDGKASQRILKILNRTIKYGRF